MNNNARINEQDKNLANETSNEIDRTIIPKDKLIEMIMGIDNERLIEYLIVFVGQAIAHWT